MDERYTWTAFDEAVLRELFSLANDRERLRARLADLPEAASCGRLERVSGLKRLNAPAAVIHHEAKMATPRAFLLERLAADGAVDPLALAAVARRAELEAAFHCGDDVDWVVALEWWCDENMWIPCALSEVTDAALRAEIEATEGFEALVLVPSHDGRVHRAIFGSSEVPSVGANAIDGLLPTEGLQRGWLAQDVVATAVQVLEDEDRPAPTEEEYENSLAIEDVVGALDGFPPFDVVAAAVVEGRNEILGFFRAAVAHGHAIGVTAAGGW